MPDDSVDQSEHSIKNVGKKPTGNESAGTLGHGEKTKYINYGQRRRKRLHDKIGFKRIITIFPN